MPVGGGGGGGGAAAPGGRIVSVTERDGCLQGIDLRTEYPCGIAAALLLAREGMEWCLYLTFPSHPLNQPSLIS
jgi:hypothetical protein